MMRKTTTLFVSCVAAGLTTAQAFAAAPVPFANTFYTTDFETDQSASWNTDTNPGPGVGTSSVDYNFAFSGLDGLSGTGVKVVANTDPGSAGDSTQQTTLDISALTGGAVTELTGSYQLSVDVWMSYSQAGPGSGTSEWAYVGINTTPGVSPHFESGYANSGTYAISSVDGDVGGDISVRDSASPTDGLTTVTDPSNFDAPYVLGVDPATIGNGAVINGWQTWTLQYNAGTDTINFWIDGVEVPFEDELLFIPLNTDIPNNSGVTSGSVSLGTVDAVAGSSAFPLDQFVIYDNVTITTEDDLLAGSLVGDLNNDGFVGIDDLNIVLGNWNLNVPPANPLADPSGDNFVGIDDLNQVLGNWNAGTPPTGGAAVPEPATLALLGLGGVAMLRRR